MDSKKLLTFDEDIWVGIGKSSCNYLSVVSSSKVKVKSEELIFEAVMQYANQFPPSTYLWRYYITN